MGKNHAIVIGAGPGGLTAAWHLAKSGARVTVLESDLVYCGGLSRTIQWKGFRFDIGGHRFFSKNPEITQWWNDRLNVDFIKVRRLSRIMYQGKLFDYPLKVPEALKNLGFKTSLSCLLWFCWRQLRPIRPEVSFEDWVINKFGDRLYRIFFKTYTEKVWGIPCTKISADWASQRIMGLSLGSAIWHAFGGAVSAKSLIEEFDYPRLGAGMMWEKARDEIVEGGGQVFLDQTATKFERSGNRIVSVSTESKTGARNHICGDEFIVSMPLRDFISSIDESVPTQVRAAAEKLRYRSFILVFLVVNKPNLFHDNWIYVHDPGVKVGRIQNFNNWGGGMVNDSSVTGLELEYFCDKEDEFWRMNDSEILELAKQELVKLKLVEFSAICDGCVFRFEKAYPVYDEDYKENVRVIRQEIQKLENLQVIGRNGMHKYNNQDHSMLTGKLAAENLFKSPIQIRHDIWAVNTSAEYLERENIAAKTPSER